MFHDWSISLSASVCGSLWGFCWAIPCSKTAKPCDIYPSYGDTAVKQLIITLCVLFLVLSPCLTSFVFIPLCNQVQHASRWQPHVPGGGNEAPVPCHGPHSQLWHQSLVVVQVQPQVHHRVSGVCKSSSLFSISKQHMNWPICFSFVVMYRAKQMASMCPWKLCRQASAM